MVLTYYGNHNHSDYSNIRGLDSINKIERLIDYAIDIGLSGISITEHECVSSHVIALQYLKKKKAEVSSSNKYDDDYKQRVADFTLGLGNEIYLVRNGLNKSNYRAGEDKYFHFILVAKDEIGHKQIRELSSRAWLRSYYQFVERVPTYYSDFDDIVGEDKGHLIATTACLGGYLPGLYFKYAKASKVEKERLYSKMQNFCNWGKLYFGDDFYIELQPSYEKEQRMYNKFVYQFAKDNNIRAIIATDAHYLTQEDRPVHKAYLNAAESEREVDAFYASTFVMTVEEIHSYMGTDFTEDEIDEMLTNTMLIKAACTEYSLYHKPIVPKSEMHDFTLNIPSPLYADRSNLSAYINSEDKADQFLAYLIFEGLEKRIPKEDYGKTLDRVDSELKDLKKLSLAIGDNMTEYLLIVREIVNIIWSEGDSLVGPSRGSALGFVIDYLIGITQINPIDREIPLPSWRFINSERVGMPDIDIDTEQLKRDKILRALKKKYGELNVINVATFRTEKSKSAIATAARGLGIDVDISQYISSMVPMERGFLWSLHDCYYGNGEDRVPIKNFVKEMNSNPDLWEVAQKIEGLISGRSSHASGVLITNEDFSNHNALMRTPKGVLISQYDLNDSEYMGGLKFDLLTVMALDRIRTSMELLQEFGFIEAQPTLRETYDKYFHPEVLEYEDEKMWELAWRGEVLSLFQFETQVGGDAIRRTRPKSLVELAIINSLMRLMASEGEEMPIDVYIKHKENIQTWYDEMKMAGLSPEEVKIMEKHLLPLYGVADSQESAMLMVMDEKISGFTLGEADKLRKGIAKKKFDIIAGLEKFFYKKGEQLGTSKELLDYVWGVQLKRQFGYSFSSLHTYAYSTIAVIDLNIIYKYSPMIWNTACLIVDSSGNEEEDSYEEIEESKILETNLIYYDPTADEEDGDEELEEDDEEVSAEAKKNKKKKRSTNYGKVSTAIGKIQQRGITVSPPDINRSKFTFTPDLENNNIIFGIKGISRIGDEVVSEILAARPYSSIKDFLEKVKVNKPQMINLIKSGAFDKVSNGDRIQAMEEYISLIADKKKRLTLQNMKMLIDNNLIPEELDFCRRLFNFNKYLKKFKSDDNYILNEAAYKFFEEHYDIDILNINGTEISISQKVWDKTYTKDMDPMRAHLKAHPELLDQLNQKLWLEQWNKYCSGSISKWEMDSIGFYYHDHELKTINYERYGIKNFFFMPEEAVPIGYSKWGARQYPRYDLYRIVGTVLERDKNKHLVTILTNEGVVNVKVYQNQFTKYDKQASVKLPDGKKKIIEKSWFSRGNMLMVTGMRRGDNFVPKIYKNHQYNEPFCLITQIDETGQIKYKTEREGEA